MGTRVKVDVSLLSEEIVGANNCLQKRIDGAQACIDALQDYCGEIQLKGDAYANSRVFYEKTYVPLLNQVTYTCGEIIALNNTILPTFSGYVPDTRGFATDTDVIEEEIRRLEQENADLQEKINYYTTLMISASSIYYSPDYSGIIIWYRGRKWINETLIIPPLKNIVDGLRAFNNECANIYSSINTQLQRIAKTVELLGSDVTWNSKLKNYVMVQAITDAFTVTVNGVSYFPGDPREPFVVFDNDYAYDPNFKPNKQDYLNWMKWNTLLTGAETLGYLPDGCAAYRRYVEATGMDLIVDYEKAYRQDIGVKDSVDAKMNEGILAAFDYYNKTKSDTFSLSGNASISIKYPVTENWQKTIGGHQIWNSMDVTVTGQVMTMELTVHELDRYNFNKDMQDIATGAKDEENGRFELAGWAKSFTTRGTVSRTITVDLNNFNATATGVNVEGVSIEGMPRGKIGEGDNR